MAKKTSFKNAAIDILKNSQTPLSTKEIYKIIEDKNMVASEGKTPSATLAAQLYTDAKKENSIFILVDKGRFALKEKESTYKDDPFINIKKINENIKLKLKETLMTMDPYQFEHLIGELLKRIGYDSVVVTKRSKDGGIDVKAILAMDGITSVNTVIQVKRHSNNIQDSVIRELRGSAEIHERGLVITTSNFSARALTESSIQNKIPISLVDGDKLIELLVKYKLGVKSKNVEILEIDETLLKEFGEVASDAEGEKSRSIWPLPGGYSSYVNTLNSLLDFIKEKEPTKAESSKWFRSKFENVESEKTILGYLGVPRSMGLVQLIESKYKLTELGEKYIKKKEKENLFNIIQDNIYVFSEIYNFIISSEGCTEDEILEFVNTEFDAKWSTATQVTYRILWLLDLKKIKKVDRKLFKV